ncbi:MULTISPECIES: aerobic carbon-monoxide dehydrogenase large subunit [unclassified Cryobacterium]|uniref:aerobic carbon-monoxide dehydrogenase large subunit n=1 Tax=unclassified Cryobacterium TaxID=2649013 RepID=UPI001068E1A6|nr:MULTISPECIES: aerobic carbon-monoxide dehydrogenase large subunit [unclassified Cryobacterium]TFC00218.1 carbon-monoxide dehydrogenase large subunit [Cryobacterium sp. MDB2-A-1]TFC13285.1 carbon-monoxide dehydrogenase large subunit [Cryobacterium sp. MDB2-10]TFC14082.1 carbon-monoxide dehydrogenase large subunit [Cryobacterium sp. MDB2-A-2]TFC32833.1 carbon-monoxide dehydrogenase large subunit [Cryobacterium sp. MDB1-18-2]TFC44577.1 carbon-monoxide dehydrogenase large subunit [Cryobacterium
MTILQEHAPNPAADDEGRPIGYGRLQRKEDPRFVRGRGHYVDDITLPGMLHGAILRSPVAHARLVSIDTTAALAHPGVVAVITGADLLGLGLAWAPTLSADVQAVLVTDKVRFQGQEVAFVVAEDRYAARDALELIEVDYDVLPPVVDARKALDADAPVVRDEMEGRTDNHIFDWEAGNKAETDAVFAAADVVVSQEIVYPRSHPAPMETCGAVADFDAVTGKLTLYETSQAPHAHRTLFAMVAGIPEHKIRIVSPDIGGGFGNKVGIYPGYILAVVGSIVTGKPVKWMEDRSENLMSTSFARDYIMQGEIAATKDGRILAVRTNVLADHGAFNATAQPTKYPAGFFHIFTGSYDLQAAHCSVTGVYTNKAPGGVAYACSFRVTEAVYLVERLVDILAAKLEMDPAELRLKNLIKPEQFPYPNKTGWEYDSGDYERALRLSMKMAGYDDLRREQQAKRDRGELMGIGISFFTETVGAGPRKHMDIVGLGMNDGAELRVHPTGKAVVRISVQSQGQGHETTFAQIVAEEIGIPPEDIDVVHGDTDQTPFGLGTYGSRSTPVSGAAVALVARKVREKARFIAAAMLETRPEDLEWEKGRWFVKGDPSVGKTIAEIAMGAYGTVALPEGIDGNLDAEVTYDPPNLTFPFGAYICVVDVDPGTGHVTVRRFVAVDDCGTRINPMIIEGQVHGGLTDGVGMALMQFIEFDESGNNLGGSFMDYLIPTAMEVPDWETGYTVTPSPHHPIGAKGIGESATVGSPPAIVNAVVDALAPFGITHMDMPCTPARVWAAIQGRPRPPI